GVRGAASPRDRIPPPGEGVDIESEGISADGAGGAWRAEQNRDNPREALAPNAPAGFEDQLFPANREGIFGRPCNLGHHDGDGALSDLREGTFIAGIGIEHSRSADSHMIERIDPIRAHSDWIDR